MNLIGKTLEESEKILEIWATAIKDNNLYGFGLSRRAYIQNPIPPTEVLILRGIYDNNPDLWGLNIFGSEIINPARATCCPGKIVVFMEGHRYPRVRDQLLSFGLKENYDFIDIKSFWTLLAFYRYETLVPFNPISIMATFRCTMRCVDCQVKIPYIKLPDFSLEKLKETTFDLFRCFDRAYNINISAGEPLLYPYLAEYSDFFWENFRHKSLLPLSIVTNGTIIPKEKLMSRIKRHGIIVRVSDYSHVGMPGYEQKLAATLKAFRASGIQPIVEANDVWQDFVPNAQAATKLKNFNDEEMRLHFAGCGSQNMTMVIDHNGRLFHCCKPLINELTTETTEKKAVDLTGLSADAPGDRQTLLMYWLGYSEHGYMDYCRFCTGKESFPQPIKAAVQLSD